MTPESLLERLNLKQSQAGFESRHEQLLSWRHQITMLRAALTDLPDPDSWRLVLEYSMIRLGHRIDAVLLHPRAIIVLEFKDKDGVTLADHRQVEDYALDLRDFHAGSRTVPIVPILVANTVKSRPTTLPLLFGGHSCDVIAANGADLGALLTDLIAQMPHLEPLNVAQWEHAAYRPVPPIVDAARTLYGRHGVEEIRSARADAHNLTTTVRAIEAAIVAGQRRVVVFVTGIPGAGKTLCGLDVAFARGGSFLTGNPSLVHVFREALARDIAREPDKSKRAAHRPVNQTIQQLPWFRTEYLTRTDHWPSETLVVIDEAQRCWSGAHASRKTAKKPLHLTQSEPAYLLDIMARHPEPVAMVCLIGNGQEIHTGEGGLAEWSAALAERSDWAVFASPATLDAPEPRQRLANLPGLTVDPALHLTVATRSIINQRATDWVEAVLRSDRSAARAIANDTSGDNDSLPFFLTRSLADMRAWLRAAARGNRRCGLVASSGAARLRADGLGAELPHMDASAVAHWFLDRWPEDVRASDALEQVATEFSCQGLELDYVGLCWGGDFLRQGRVWRPRAFKGTKWQEVRKPDDQDYRRNTYRVLLTRARYATVIWVPQGDAHDTTRQQAELDAVADYLRACGARELPRVAEPVADERGEMSPQMAMF